MANPFRLRAAAKEVPEAPAKRSLVAAAVNINELGIASFKARRTNDVWQRVAWHHFDVCGELRYATTWIANAVSMASMYVAEVDPDTGLVTEATENRVVNTVARSILGGPAERSQFQATMALNWQIAGEFFILITPQGPEKPDKWVVLSSSEVIERNGGLSYRDPYTEEMINISPRDLPIRVWSPHPQRRSHADSAVRAAIPTLNEIEKASQNIASRLDSRLANNGFMILPQEVDFPGDNGVQGFVEDLSDAAALALDNPGQASAHVPIMFQVPGEQVGNVKHIDTATEMDSSVLDLRIAAIRRLALSLDMPAEIMLGMGEANHWTAWQVEESAYKVHIAPLLDRIGDALTTKYLRPALVNLGVPDPDRYIIAYDTTEIISRPDRFDEEMRLHDKFLVSDDYIRSRNGIPDDAKPTDEERQRQVIISIIEAAPTLLGQFPALGRAVGLDLPETPSDSSSDIEAVNALDEPEETSSRALPEANMDGDTVTASAQPHFLDHLTTATEMIVFDALNRAGGRLLTRSYRGQFQSTPKHTLHTVIPFAENDLSRLTEGSFQLVDRVAQGFGVDSRILATHVRGYVEEILTNRREHDTKALRSALWQMTR